MFTSLRARSPAPLPIMVTALLHAALLVALLAHRMPANLVRREMVESDIVWLPALRDKAILPPAPPPLPTLPPAVTQKPAMEPDPVPARQVTKTEAIRETEEEIENARRVEAARANESGRKPESTRADPFDLSAPALSSTTTATAATADNVLRQPSHGAGKVDNQLRNGKAAKLIRPTDTLQAGLERAFREAGEAVPPKWYERADIREISTPDSLTRVYKIRTALGTHCVYMPDPRLESRTTYIMKGCPREK